MNNNYDVIIIGAGPSGLAAAKTLNSNFKIALIDCGKNYDKRTSVTSGFGGSGLFSDGKLVISDTIGGNIKEYCSNSSEAINLACELFETNKYISHVGKPISIENINLMKKAREFNLELVPSSIIHLGTDGARKFVEKMYQELKDKCDIRLNFEVTNIISNDSGFNVICENNYNKEILTSKYIIFAAGRSGSLTTKNILRQCGLNVKGNRVDLGVRIEVPNKIVEELVNFNHDFKIYYKTKNFNDQVRTFCVCPSGKVIAEDSYNLITCNGQSYSEGSKERTDFTNFSLLVSLPFDNPINPIEYGKSIVSLANNISKNGVIVQRFEDLIFGRRSTESRIKNHYFQPTLDAYPGDLSLVMPHRYLTDIIETVQALTNISPGLSNKALLYGVEAKFYSNILELKEMETKIPNLFCVGDGSGVSRGILQAASSGIVAAKQINQRV